MREDISKKHSESVNPIPSFSFSKPERVLILHNHFPLGCLGGACTSYPVDPSVGHLQHYRADCVRTLKKSCEDTYKNVSVLDTAIWRHKEQVIKR